jgi:ADP-dependent NAD(P)H-hydrate dehydratase / NAD(P)H-hydrate epimerase
MRSAHAVTDVRAAEHALMELAPEGALMQRAAAGLASVCVSLLGRVYGSSVVVLAGTGDNGGDALFVGARLAGRGAKVIAIATGTRLHEAGAAALRRSGGRIINATALQSSAPSSVTPPAGLLAERGSPVVLGERERSDPVVPAVPASPGPAATAPADVASSAADAIMAADLIIDGILGIGGHGGLREPAKSLAKLTAGAARAGAVVVATDLPSGVDADTGETGGEAIRADVTVTFGTIKPGLLIDPGASHAGTVQLVDIGLGPHLTATPAAIALQSEDVAALLPRPGAESDKYRRGVLGVLAGSDRFTGAAVLSVGGAIRGGAGMVRFASARPAVEMVRQHWPEAVTTVIEPGGDPSRGASPAAVIESIGRVQAWVAGPGLGTGADAEALLAAVLATPLPVLVDADGLTILARRKDLLARQPGAPTLITPHAGELARLLNATPPEIEAGRLTFARRAASELAVTVLLKGSTTVVASPDPAEPVYVNPTGTPWLATAGSGDVLSGLAGALLAQGVQPVSAVAAAAAFLHGLAGRLAARDAPIGATDLMAAIPEAFRLVHAD